MSVMSIKMSVDDHTDEQIPQADLLPAQGCKENRF